MASRPPRNPFIVPLLLVVVLVGAAVAIAFLNRQAAPAAEQATAARAPSPFEDLPPDTPPAKVAKASTGRAAKVAALPDFAGNRFAADPAWVAIAEQGARADQLFEAAVAARDASEHGRYVELAREAKALYEPLLEACAALESQLALEHGDTDPDVRDVARARAFWEERRAFLHKFAH